MSRHRKTTKNPTFTAGRTQEPNRIAGSQTNAKETELLSAAVVAPVLLDLSSVSIFMSVDHSDSSDHQILALVFGGCCTYVASVAPHLNRLMKISPLEMFGPMKSC